MMFEKIWHLMLRLFRPVLIGITATPLFAALDVAPDLGNEAPLNSSVLDGQLSRKLELLRDLRRQLDSSQFDLNALLGSLEFESMEIIEFVRNEIVFQQYPGVMRGAKGTLLSRAGNTLDQSLLLARLLKDAGYDARIVRGTLNQEQSIELLSEMIVPKPALLSDADINHVIDTVEAMNRLDGDTSNNLHDFFAELERNTQSISESETYKSVKRNAREIKEALASEEIELDSGTSLKKELIEEARDYFWVEYKERVSGPWKAAHPASKEAKLDSSNIQPEQVYVDTIPDELHQTIEISAKVVQSLGGERLEHDIMSPWRRPVANLQGKSLTYTNSPLNALAAKDITNVDELIRSAEAFLPVFNGSLAPGAQVFDLAGRVVPPDAASSPAAQMFRTMSDKAISAIDAFSEVSSSDSSDSDSATEVSAMLLDAMFLEIKVQVPGRPDETYQTKVYERSSTQVASKASINRELNAQLTFGVSTGSNPESYFLDQTLARIDRAWPFINLLFQQANNPNQPSEVPPDKLRNFPADWPGFPTLFQSFAEAPVADPIVHYFDQPVVAIHSTALGEDDTLISKIDIKSNNRRVLALDGSHLTLEPKTNLELGVWDTHLEQLLVSDMPGHSVPQYMAGARQQNIELMAVVTREAASEIERLPLTKPVKAQLATDLNKGYAIIIPSRPISDQDDYFAWWRVDPKTGRTLGALHDGSGGAQAILPLSVSATEWVIQQLIGVVISSAFAYGNYNYCVKSGGDAICCRNQALLQLSLGMSGGIVVSLTYRMTFKQFLWATVGIASGLTAYKHFALPDELTDCK